MLQRINVSHGSRFQKKKQMHHQQSSMCLAYFRILDQGHAVLLCDQEIVICMQHPWLAASSHRSIQWAACAWALPLLPASSLFFAAQSNCSTPTALLALPLVGGPPSSLQHHVVQPYSIDRSSCWGWGPLVSSCFWWIIWPPHRWRHGHA